jgi:hypothetical protein
MSLNIKIFVVFLPLLFIVLSILRGSGNLNEQTGLIVVFLSALTGLVVNRFNNKNKKH